MSLKKICHCHANFQNQIFEGKVLFKTTSLDWVNTEESVIVPLSVHTAFHEGILGELKMNAFMSTIKNNVKGKVTVLLTEKAHLNVLSLKYNNDVQRAFEDILIEANLLEARFKSLFEGCHVDYWHNYINEDCNYHFFFRQVMKLYETDPIFQRHVQDDAEKTYTIQRAVEFPDKAFFISNAVKDVLENCAYLFVIVNKSHRFQFYPGIDRASRKYLNNFLSPEQQISFINVTVKPKSISFKGQNRPDLLDAM